MGETKLDEPAHINAQIRGQIARKVERTITGFPDLEGLWDALSDVQPRRGISAVRPACHARPERQIDVGENVRNLGHPTASDYQRGARYHRADRVPGPRPCGATGQ